MPLCHKPDMMEELALNAIGSLLGLLRRRSCVTSCVKGPEAIRSATRAGLRYRERTAKAKLGGIERDRHDKDSGICIVVSLAMQDLGMVLGGRKSRVVRHSPKTCMGGTSIYSAIQ